MEQWQEFYADGGLMETDRTSLWSQKEDLRLILTLDQEVFISMLIKTWACSRRRGFANGMTDLFQDVLE